MKYECINEFTYKIYTNNNFDIFNNVHTITIKYINNFYYVIIDNIENKNFWIKCDYIDENIMNIIIKKYFSNSVKNKYKNIKSYITYKNPLESIYIDIIDNKLCTLYTKHLIKIYNMQDFYIIEVFYDNALSFDAELYMIDLNAKKINDNFYYELLHNKKLTQDECTLILNKINKYNLDTLNKICNILCSYHPEYEDINNTLLTHLYIIQLLNLDSFKNRLKLCKSIEDIFNLIKSYIKINVNNDILYNYSEKLYNKIFV